ncbi:hypothetical protein RGQ29_018439 [Quercus rubra]|uniref:Receptor-like serine/threonine-protein kinase n=1 Tax=Quercus rubra TaxID=3512 RepID=A0AAN7J237_QUERU|nr:hypothetical protein RGQ29_018439 [Quercus rubra]
MATHLTLLKFLFLLFFSSFWTSHAQYIKPGGMLSSFTGPSLDSPNGRFGLGFALWSNYTSLCVFLVSSNDTANIIWCLSPGIPSANDSDEFILENKDGALRIRRPGGIPITLCSSATNKTVATLLDSGNFVFNEVYSNGSTKRVLWQSFDHLTEVLIPGMKLGVNHKTGQNWSLTSRLTGDIPNPGAFTLEWDPKGLELVIRQRGVVHWKSGVLRDNQFENISPHLASMYDFNVVSNGDEEYFSLKYKNQSLPQTSWALSPTGQLMEVPINRDVLTGGADNCYGYNTEGGCQRWSQSDCRHNGDKVDLKSGSFADIDYLFHPRYDSTPDTNLAISDCKVKCLNNCSCVAFHYLYENATGCKFWTNISTFLADDSPRSENLYIITPAPSNSANPNNIKPEPSNSANPNNITPKPYQSGKSKWIWIGIVIAIAFVTFSCIMCYCCLLPKRKVVLKGHNETTNEKELCNSMISNRFDDVNEFPNDGKNGSDITIFSYECIKVATNNFSLENKLGEGGFGPVYMGKLLTSQQIAIKQLSRNSRQGIIEFKNELILISKLQHMNLVKLLGCCIFGEERMLVYEYMPNKSLDYFLFDSNQRKLLDWKKRFNIIEGIAQGLIYLHKYSRLKVIHRDLKASNILLDESMNPKISDFGMARIFKQNEVEANTNRIVGTYGYMSPEYAMEGVFSIKSDVYSFGVLMLEIVSGRKNNSFYDDEHALNLVGYAWDLWQEGKGLELVDLTIRESCVEYQVLRCIHVSLLCVEDGAIDRPTMLDMLSMLTNESTQLPLPKKPAFSIRRKSIVANIPNEEPEVYTVNNLSITDMDPR